jgi:hypothetical protein
MLAKAVNDLVRSDDELEALVGCGVHPVLLPQGAKLPVILYQLVGSSGSPTLNTSGMQKRRYQFDVIAETYVQADLIRSKLVFFLNGYQGLLSDGTYLQNVEFVQAIDFFDNTPRQFRCMSEFYFYFDFPS